MSISREKGLTSDGIATEDWDRVHELTLRIGGAPLANVDATADEVATQRLLAVLDELEAKYGARPSILATRGHYAETDEDREYWLLAAYQAAERMGDQQNLMLTASALASLYVEDLEDKTRGAEWLLKLEGHLREHPDPFEEEELSRLLEALDTL
jgi:hypothetical protein